MSTRVNDIAAVTFLKLMGVLPASANRFAGRTLGKALTLIPNEARRITRINIDLCHPHLSEADRARLVKDSLVETGITLCEMGWTWSRDPEASVARVTSVQGESILDDALAAGRGVLLLVPHLGNWEVAGYWLAKRHAFAAMYKPSPLERLNALILHSRARLDTTLVPTDNSGVIALYKRLKKGGMIAILPDQEPDAKGGEYADFMGIPALTQTLGPRLVRDSNAAVIGLMCLRDGEGYRIVLDAADPDVVSGDTAVALRALNASVERWVALAPAQYQWEYKRFGKRPKGSPKLYQRDKR
jgi:KDO2-lipid IV(A) lauroyltransferase